MKNYMEDKKYIVHGGYIGVLVYYECGFPMYRFKGGVCVGDDRCVFDTREEAEKYALETYGHAD